MHSMMAMNRERKRNGLHATATQLITRESPNKGSFASTTTRTIIGKLYRKLNSCETTTGPAASIPITRPNTNICHGYSYMLIGASIISPRHHESRPSAFARSGRADVPVILVQNSDARKYTPIASNQHFLTLEWL